MNKLTALFGISFVLLGCHDADQYSPTSPDYQQALVLEASPASLPADGFSTSTVTATISPAADQPNRMIVFECSCALVDGASPLERTVGADGRASVRVRADQQPGSVVVRVKVKAIPAVAAEVVIEQTLADPDETIRLSVSQGTALADGASTTAVVAYVSTKIPAANREVSFLATRGTFLQSEGGAKSAKVTPDQSGHARVDFVSDATPGIVRITATAFAVSRETAIELIPAFPESIVVQPDKESIKATSSGADGSVSLSIDMRRTIGNASAGLVPIITVVDPATGAEIPVLLRNVTPTSSSGTAQAVVIAGPVAFRGIARIEVRVAGSTTVGTANIEITDAT